MKLNTLLSLLVVALFATSCGSDEPDVSQSTMMNEVNGKTVLSGTDVYLTAANFLESPSGKYCISICQTGTTASSADIQKVAVSLNTKMKVAARNTYAIIDRDYLYNFPSGKVAALVGAPVIYLEVTELIDGGFHYLMSKGNVEQGSLPKNGTSYSCTNFNGDSWTVTIPLDYNKFEFSINDKGEEYKNYDFVTANSMEGTVLRLAYKRTYYEELNDIHHQRTLNMSVFIRSGSACAQCNLHD